MRVDHSHVPRWNCSHRMLHGISFIYLSLSKAYLLPWEEMEALNAIVSCTTNRIVEPRIKKVFGRAGDMSLVEGDGQEMRPDTRAKSTNTWSSSNV